MSRETETEFSKHPDCSGGSRPKAKEGTAVIRVARILTSEKLKNDEKPRTIPKHHL